MTLFVLGVIVGWVLEYIAYTFWWKGRMPSGGDNSTERTDYEARMSAKDREIAQLQLKLQNAAKVVVEEKMDTPTPQKVDQPEPMAKSAEAAAMPEPVEDAVEKKDEPVQDAAETKAAPKKAAKKSVKKKAASKKAAPEKKAVKPKTAATEKVVPLTTISGIGAVIGEVLSKAGYESAASLANVDEATIQAVLEKAEIRPGNTASWIVQAKLIADGDMAGLAELKKML